MVAAKLKGSISGLGRTMMQRGSLPEHDTEMMQAHAISEGVGFVEQLIHGKNFKEAEDAKFAAMTFDLPLVDIAKIDLGQMPVKAIDYIFLQTRRAIPLRQSGNRLFVGVSDPTNRAILEQLKFHTGLQIEPVVVEDAKLGALVHTLVQANDVTLRDLARENFGASLVAEAGPAEEPQTDIGNEIDDAPVVLYIQKILLDAINALASDVNFEPYEKFYRVRDRTDDIQYEFAQPLLALTEKTASRINAISRPDISEKRVPRDGRMNLAPSKNRATDFRLGTLPTPHGEKIVMRILDTSSTTLAIETLGCGQDQKEELIRTWIKEDELDENWAPHKAVGCDAFKSIGYKARVGIHEVMRISEEMNQVIMTNGNAIDVAEQAQREGIRDLRQSGLLKVKQSVTSLEEIEADTNE